MKRIRLPVSLLIVWLFLFYNLERFYLEGLVRPIDISQAAYIVVPIAALVALLSPIHKVNIWLIIGGSVLSFLVLGLLLSTGLTNPFVVAIEVGAITGTVVLARWVSHGVMEFEHAVVNITLGQIGERRSRQGEMYREVKRARDHHRPLTLVAIKPDESSISLAIDRMVKQAQEAMIRQYVLSSLSKTLSDELDDYNIIAKSKDYFLVLLPEVPPEKLPEVEKRLRRVVAERVGVAVQIGTASLSRELSTFEALVQKAIEAITVIGDDKLATSRTTTSAVKLLDQAVLSEGTHGRNDH